MDKAANKKKKKPTLIQWDMAEYETARANADAAKLALTEYVRAMATCKPVRLSRGISLAERKLLAKVLGALNDSGDRLGKILDELQVGDIPLAATITSELGKIDRASHTVIAVLANVEAAAQACVSELERP